MWHKKSDEWLTLFQRQEKAVEKSETVRGRWIKTGVYRESSDVEIEG